MKVSCWQLTIYSREESLQVNCCAVFRQRRTHGGRSPPLRLLLPLACPPFSLPSRRGHARSVLTYLATLRRLTPLA